MTADSSTSSPSAPIVVVGAGLAGLNCARDLHLAGHRVVVVEADDGVGGRVRTDRVDGFSLDRGFQVFFTAYPEARRVLDYDALDFRPFKPGALVRADGAFHKVIDPFRAPIEALGGVMAPVGTIGDKMRVLLLRQRALNQSLEAIFRAPERPIREELAEIGFSPMIIDRFFTPFLGGIFLDPDLVTTSRMLYFVYRMLSEGETVVPAAGMGAIPAQLASALPDGSLRLRTRVCGIRRRDQSVTGVVLEQGEELDAAAVVVATDFEEAATLTGARQTTTARPVSCVYFAADRSPVSSPMLVLNGEGRGPVLNLAVMTDVAPTYGPEGQALISAVVVGTPGASDADLEQSVRAQMREWYGDDEIRSWRHLRTYRIRWAQFDQSPGTLEPAARPVRRSPGLYVCGDHVENASINGALAAGRRAAEAILSDLASGGAPRS